MHAFMNIWMMDRKFRKWDDLAQNIERKLGHINLNVSFSSLTTYVLTLLPSAFIIALKCQPHLLFVNSLGIAPEEVG